MEKSICTFISSPTANDALKFINFVYETEFHKLKLHPLRSTCAMHLTVSGSGSYTLSDKTFELTRGSLFFMFPNCPFRLSGSDDFKYMYITFMGSGVTPILERAGITPKNPVFQGYEELIDFWMSSLKGIVEDNADIVAESVYSYTLSNVMADMRKKEKDPSVRERSFEAIKEYIRLHYADTDLDLLKISDAFFYNPKYFSGLFKKNAGIGFNRYLRQTRVRKACELLRGGVKSVSEVSFICGFSDPLYFSKVFKQETGLSPADYLKAEAV